MKLYTRLHKKNGKISQTKYYINFGCHEARELHIIREEHTPKLLQSVEAINENTLLVKLN